MYNNIMSTDEIKKITLEDLGYTEFFEQGRKALGLEGAGNCRT